MEDRDGGISRILVVDDDPIAREMLGDCLSRGGNLEVREAENGLNALVEVRRAWVEGRPYDLLLVDLMMPEMNGFEFLRTLRKREWGKAVPVMVATARDDRSSVEACAGEKIAGYILKPFEPAVVLGRVRGVLMEAEERARRRRAREERAAGRD
jgi:CheY-like chemotaxis protein